MSGKLIIHGCRPNKVQAPSPLKIYLDGEKVGTVRDWETVEFPIEKDCQVILKCGINLSKGIVNIQDGMRTEVQGRFDKGKIFADIIKTTPITIDEQESDRTEQERKERICSIPEIRKFEGARGRTLEVCEDKCILTTRANVGSFLTGNVTDGEKTIYYVDCIGVQFKRAGVTLGYLQLETASSLGNNKKSNFFNENTFTFNPELNEQMGYVADYVKQQIDLCKKAKSAPDQATVIQQTSAADELKKFKELLDMGVITQEEFDAKKKQLLGL